MSLFQVILTIPTVRSKHIIHGNLTAVSFHCSSVDTCLTGCNEPSPPSDAVEKTLAIFHMTQSDEHRM